MASKPGRSALRRISSLLRAAAALVRGVFSLGGVLVVAALLAFNVATLTLSGLSAAVSGAIAAVSGVQTIAARQGARAAALETDLTAARKTALARSDALTRARGRVAALETDLATARRQAAAQADELARARLVMHRGRSKTIAAAVSETTERIGRRTATATARNVAAVAGESLPFWGIGVIVAATAYELHAACETMKDLHELDLAFNPDATLDPERTQVCASEVPTAGEVWSTVSESPGEVASAARALYAELPPLELAPLRTALWDWWNGPPLE